MWTVISDILDADDTIAEIRDAIQRGGGPADRGDSSSSNRSDATSADAGDAESSAETERNDEI